MMDRRVERVKTDQEELNVCSQLKRPRAAHLSLASIPFMKIGRELKNSHEHFCRVHHFSFREALKKTRRDLTCVYRH